MKRSYIYVCINEKIKISNECIYLYLITLRFVFCFVLFLFPFFFFFLYFFLLVLCFFFRVMLECDVKTLHTKTIFKKKKKIRKTLAYHYA